MISVYSALGFFAIYFVFSFLVLDSCTTTSNGDIIPPPKKKTKGKYHTNWRPETTSKRRSRKPRVKESGKVGIDFLKAIITISGE